MFYKQLRKKYAGITEEDEDVQKYFKILNDLQSDGYKGLMGKFQDMGHQWVSRFTTEGRSLEIGFGRGRQAHFFRGDPGNYYPLELRRDYVNPETWGKFPNGCIADAVSLPFPDGFFDNVVSIYNFEHIREIFKVFAEIKRVLKPGGKLIVALPCEGGFLWNLGRTLTSRRIFQKKYHFNYDKAIAFEHVHSLAELKKMLKKEFRKSSSVYFPFFLPLTDINVIYCAIYQPKQ